MLVGAVLVVIGCASALAPTDLSALRDGAEAVAITLVGVALITGPWWVRMATELTEERRERIRSQERATLAAHLHDSVLQTLALIQSNAESPREVVRLARVQERALRSMLYAPTNPCPVGNLADTVRAAAADVEDAYAISVEVVVVGDAPLDDALTALIAATREALINAARHAGVDTASLYVEVDDTAVASYVRDRGKGFDPDCVPPDRHGLRGSIVDRVQRHGGTTTIRSEPGWGTEITIKVPR
jgi:signal transduction histidine kinase